MSKKLNHVLTIFLIALACIGLIAYFSKMRMEERKYGQFKRIYASDSLILLYSFKAKGNIESIKIHKDKMFLFDNVTQIVSCYQISNDSCATFLGQFGGKGKGPNEYTHITGISFNEAGNVKISDRNSMALTEVEYDNGRFFEKKYKKLPIVPESYSYVGKSKGLIWSSDRDNGYESCFYIYDEALDTAFSVGNLIDEQDEFQNDILSSSGYFVESDDYMAFACRLYGCIVIFDKDAKFINRVKTIDQTPPPRVFVTDGGGSIMLDFANSRLVNASVSIDSERMLVLSKIKSKYADIEKQMDVIDIYELPSGKYEKSMLLPSFKNERASVFSKKEDKIFAFYGEEILCFKVYKPE